jgi:hypothetical protein
VPLIGAVDGISEFRDADRSGRRFQILAASATYAISVTHLTYATHQASLTHAASRTFHDLPGPQYFLITPTMTP